MLQKLSLKSEHGFTIVEIIVGLVVLPIYVYAIGLVINSTGALNDQGRDLTLANGVAEKQIEALRSADYVSLPDDGTVVDFESELPSTLRRPRSAEYTIVEINPSLKQIDLEITYTVGGRTEVLDYSTFIGELGIGQ